jgi:hypothetical protein
MKIGERMRYVASSLEDNEYGYHISSPKNHESIKKIGLRSVNYPAGRVSDFSKTNQHLLWYSVDARKRKFKPSIKHYRFKLDHVPVKSIMPQSGAMSDRLAFSDKSFKIPPSKIEVLNEKSKWEPIE